MFLNFSMEMKWFEQLWTFVVDDVAGCVVFTLRILMSGFRAEDSRCGGSWDPKS